MTTDLIMRVNVRTTTTTTTSEVSPGVRFSRSPFAEVGHRRPFFRRHVVVLLCGWDVAVPRSRRRPSGTRELQLFWGGVVTNMFSTIEIRHYHDVIVLDYIVWILHIRRNGIDAINTLSGVKNKYIARLSKWLVVVRFTLRRRRGVYAGLTCYPRH